MQELLANLAQDYIGKMPYHHVNLTKNKNLMEPNQVDLQ